MTILWSNHNMRERPHENCYWVVPGRLMAGEYPIAIREEDGLRKLSAIVAAGIGHFIDLTQTRDPLEPYVQMLHKVVDQACHAPGYDRFAITDMGIPDSPSLMNAVLDRIDGLLAKNRVTYIHCWGGIGRTGTVVGCWLVRQGQSGEHALDTIAGHWSTVAKRFRYPQSPQTDEQCDYVLQWARYDQVLRRK
jgi:protein-tyrosine phosphatase